MPIRKTRLPITVRITNPTNHSGTWKCNLGGIRDGDFTMILGYPASTTQYLHSDVVRYMLESSLPLKIGLRTTRLEIMDALYAKLG